MLRPYQQAALDEIRRYYARGVKRVLLHLATGSGKTVVFCEILKSVAAKNKKAIMVVRRRALVEQASKRLEREGVDHGVIMAGHWRKRHDANISICSIDTLYARKLAPPADLVVIDECYTPDMEILTSQGFIRFDKLNKSELVAQYNPQNKEINFCGPLRWIEKEVTNQKIITFKSDKKIDVSVTENHEILNISCTGLIKKEKAGTMKIGNKSFLNSGYSSGSEKHLTPFEKLTIAFQADGNSASSHRAHFQFSKQRKIDKFISLMKEGGFSFYEIKGEKSKGNVKAKRRFSVSSVSWNKTKLLSLEFKLENMSFEKCRELIEYMVHWDGSKISDNLYYYSSAERLNTDFIQAVAIMAGFSTNYSIQKDNRSVNFRDMHRVFISKNKNKFTSQGIKKTESIYSGKVYCVTVPFGNVIVRRNGKPLICGNCQDATSDGYHWLAEQYPNAYFLPVTATPYCNKSLRHVADEIIRPIRFKELIDQGYLVGPKYFAPSVPDLTGVKTNRAGDYDIQQLDEILNKSHPIGDIVATWKAMGENRPTLCFAVSVKHSKSITAAFNASGIPALHIEAGNSDSERQDAIKKLESGEIKVLSNVGIVNTGVDIPCVSCLIMARPTKSYTLYIQTSGRGSRIFPGKSDFIILDHGGNTMRHGLITEDREGSLDPIPKTGKQTDPGLVTCEACYAVFPVAKKECPACGEKNGKAPSNSREDKAANPIDAALTSADMEHLRIISRRGELRDIQKRKGYRRGWVWFKLKDEFGEDTANKYQPQRQVPAWINRSASKTSP